MSDMKDKVITFSRTIKYVRDYTFDDLVIHLEDKNYTEEKLLAIWKKMVSSDKDRYEDPSHEYAEQEFDNWFEEEVDEVEEQVEEEKTCESCKQEFNSKEDDTYELCGSCYDYANK